MSPRLGFSRLASSLLVTAALAGCSASEPAPPARFADATPEQLKRTYAAATGHELREVFVFLGVALSGENKPTSCPSIVTKGQDTTITGDCTTEEGTRVEGSIVLHNVPSDHSNPAYDPALPSTMNLDLSANDAEHGYAGFSGHIEADPTHISGDLEITEKGITSISRLTIHRDVNGTYTATPGSEIEISDLGTGAVEGSWGFDRPPRGSLTVRGADVLAFDVSSSAVVDEATCTPYTIGDKSGTVCLPPIDP